tara:strand:+ start:697 stop:1665 length:969 start_codon:yes stop_codon:yes gene_type:complete
MKTKFAIGCLIQWYEVDIIEEYLETLKEAISQYDGEVIVDFCVVENQDLEKCTSSEKLKECVRDIDIGINSIKDSYYTNKNFVANIYTIADYRREFNDKYCEHVDVLIWGESDMLVPKQMFQVLDMIHQSQSKQTPKYLAFFGTCKMWDDTWKPLEHPAFTDKPFYDKPEQFKPDHWWSLRYTMTKDEMNEINDKTDELDVRIVSPHKFNGCGLVISSEVIKAGVNIPKSVFFVHEDSAFMWMTNKVLGNIPQYVIKNILLVHNRNHPKKRMYIDGERKDGTMNEKRRSNEWYVKANKMCEQNYINLFNPKYKSFTWKDVWN